MTLTKSLRWDIQSLGQRLAKAANTEELARRSSSKARTRAQSEIEVKFIMQAIRKVLDRIEDAVPLINLAITTSGASLSTTLPATVSPSRLLQASTFLTAGDTQYSIQPGQMVQIGPTFTFSVYMLFSGHAYRSHDQEGYMREATWKEVIHKARVKLRRAPLEEAYEHPQRQKKWDQLQYTDEKSSTSSNTPSSTHADRFDAPASPLIAGEGKADEFSYQLAIIEDFDDDRVHSFEEDEPQPGPYEDVDMAGIREIIPIHEVSKIFYADTGKILNIGSEGEANSPVLLLKRDVNAVPPRRMIDRVQRHSNLHDDEISHLSREKSAPVHDEEQGQIDAQLFHEHYVSLQCAADNKPLARPDAWRLPLDLDQEWIAFEVYVEQEESEDDEGISSDLESRSSRRSREASVDPQFVSAMSSLHLNARSKSVEPPAISPSSEQQQLILQSPSSFAQNNIFSNSGPIRSSLSLLEMLIRLTALQQFQQTSHLSIPDELLNFFLSESSTTGAGGDGEERRRKRWEARRKVGFDPYDESPVKVRGENGVAERQRHDVHEGSDAWLTSPENENSLPRGYRESASPSPIVVRSRETIDRATPPPSSSRQQTPPFSSLPPPERRHSTSPLSSESLKTRPAMLRDDSGARRQKQGSPLRRGATVGPDSGLGTSLGSEGAVGHQGKDLK